MDNITTMESPLDVLSRAATMIRQNADRKPRENVAGKDVSSSARWRRERRPCPLIARPRPEPRTLPTNNSTNEMAPLDMSTRRKTSSNDTKVSPPRANHSSALRISTSQKSGYKQNAEKASQRVSVITCAATNSHSSGSSAEEENESDTVIDEHFRRSLGRDYLALFPTPATSCNSTSDRKSPTSSAERAPANSSTLTGLSVDDHFAKALGETWLRLQAGEKSEDKAKVSSSTETPSPDSTRKSTLVHAPLKVST